MTRKKNSRDTIREGLTAVYPRLWRYCLVLTKDRTHANDLAQTVALRAIEKSDQFIAGTYLDRWLFTIAQRTWINEIRKQKVRTGAGLVAIDTDQLQDNSADQETNIYTSEVLSEVMALPEAQREAITLVYVEGFSYKETAAILDIPIGTVMSRLAAARAKIAQKTQDIDGS